MLKRLGISSMLRRLQAASISLSRRKYASSCLHSESKPREKIAPLRPLLAEVSRSLVISTTSESFERDQPKTQTKRSDQVCADAVAAASNKQAAVVMTRLFRF